MYTLTYLQAKVERIQYALRCVRAIIDGLNAEDLLKQLEAEEIEAMLDLIRMEGE